MATEDGRRHLVWPRPRGAEQRTVLAQGRALVETKNSWVGEV